MKNEEFTECPMCGGQLKLHTVLKHPHKGIIQDLYHHVCFKCGEIFFDEVSFDIVHSYKHKKKFVA